MEENIEIEYKQLLNLDDYTKIKEYLLNQDQHIIIKQKNYYFETSDFSLKKRKTALRIRIINDVEYELCIKKQRDKDILEKNYLITKEEFENICNNPNLMQQYLNENLDFILLGCLANTRVEYKIKEGLICLDMSQYFEQVDYEIEFEANDYESEQFFQEYLAQFNIEYKRNIESKIQRFIKAYNNK